MWKEQSKIQLQWNCLYHPFDYHTDVSLRYWPDGPSGKSVVMMRRSPEMRLERGRKILILDMDGVVNLYGSLPPVAFYVGYLIENLPHLREKRERVMTNLRGLDSSDDPSPFARNLEYDFRKAGLSKNLHERACIHAAESFQLVPGYETAMNRLANEMSYRAFVLSASPSDLISEASAKLRIGTDDFRGTEFSFKDGRFVCMDLNLGERRSKMRDEIMMNSVSTRYGPEIMVDDSWNSVRKVMKVGSNRIYMILGEMGAVKGNVSIVKQEIRRNFVHLEESVSKIERGEGVMLMMSEDEWLKAVHMSKEFVESGRRALSESGREFFTHFYRSMGILNDYVESMRGIFPYRTSSFRRRVAGVNGSVGEDVLKRRFSDLIDVFYEMSLEAKLDLASFK